MHHRPTHVSYDELPYEGGIASSTHPQNAVVIGRLFGLMPPAITSARILEIGCGEGRNLIPMAYSLPRSTFVGIDLSHTHIERARLGAERVGLTNVTFLQVDVRDFAPSGEYDYVICHGVFSWVPPEARSAILDICRTSLAPQGIAFISYNVFPGWHARGALREMMKFHARYFPSPSERIEQARAFASFLAEATAHFEGASDAATAYSLAMRSEYQVIRDRPDYYVMHEHLAEVNDPMYFLDFVDLLNDHRLRYLGDSNFSSMLTENLPDDVETSLEHISPTSEILEQYRDFIVNRAFRQSLVVREDAPVDRALNMAALEEFSIRSTIRPETDGSWQVPQAGGLLKPVRSSLVVTVLETLHGATPRSLRFEALLSQIPESAWPNGLSFPDRRSHLRSVLLSLFACDGLEFRVWDPEFAMELPDYPRAFRPALFVDNFKGTPGPHHVTYGFDPIVSWLIPLMHGYVRKERLVDLVYARISDGSLQFQDLPPGVVADRALAEQIVNAALEQLMRSALLEPPPSPANRR